VLHKASHTFSSDPERSLFVVEGLKVKNMTKKPEPKKDASGNFVRNGASAKAGLNKSILSSCWGLFVFFLSCMARGNGKLVKVRRKSVRRNAIGAGTFTRTTGLRRPSSSASAGNSRITPNKTPAA